MRDAFCQLRPAAVAMPFAHLSYFHFHMTEIFFQRLNKCILEYEWMKASYYERTIILLPIENWGPGEAYEALGT